MKRTLFYIWLLSGLLTAANCCARPVVQSVLFVHGNPALNARIGELNARLREWCAENGIDWLDLNPDLADADGLKREYTTDGTHLTEQGYAIWSGRLRRYLDNRNTNL